MPSLNLDGWKPEDYQGGVQNYRGGFSVREFKSGKTSVYRESPPFLQLFDDIDTALDFITTTNALDGET
jgi:hypothetical protein